MDKTEPSDVGSNVRFVFRKAADYKLYYSNGAYGGLTPHGDIICNFFF